MTAWLIGAGVIVGMVGAGILVGKFIAEGKGPNLHDGATMADDLDPWTDGTWTVER